MLFIAQIPKLRSSYLTELSNKFSAWSATCSNRELGDDIKGD